MAAMDVEGFGPALTNCPPDTDHRHHRALQDPPTVSTNVTLVDQSETLLWPSRIVGSVVSFHTLVSLVSSNQTQSQHRLEDVVAGEEALL